MADSKITALTAISTVDPTADPLVIVDVSDTSMAASGTTKKSTINQLLGAGGTATLASATITGALTVNGGVNLANATAVNFGGLLTIYSDTAAGLFIRGRTVSGTTFQTQDGTNPLLNISNAGVFTFSDGAGGTRMTLNSTGNLVFPTGKGIDFSAVTGGTGTATANVLNDYEEGTWTPVVADATTGGNTGTATISSATYTKIGRQVSIQCDLRSIDTTGMTGANNLFIRGLPFASVRGGNGNFYSYRISRNASTVSSATTVDSGVSHIYLSLYTTSSANTNLSVLVSDIVSGTSELALSVTYFV